MTQRDRGCGGGRDDVPFRPHLGGGILLVKARAAGCSNVVCFLQRCTGERGVLPGRIAAGSHSPRICLRSDHVGEHRDRSISTSVDGTDVADRNRHLWYLGLWRCGWLVLLEPAITRPSLSTLRSGWPGMFGSGHDRLVGAGGNCHAQAPRPSDQLVDRGRREVERSVGGKVADCRPAGAR